MSMMGINRFPGESESLEMLLERAALRVNLRVAGRSAALRFMEERVEAPRLLAQLPLGVPTFRGVVVRPAGGW